MQFYYHMSLKTFNRSELILVQVLGVPVTNWNHKQEQKTTKPQCMNELEQVCFTLWWREGYCKSQLSRHGTLLQGEQTCSMNEYDSIP